MKDRCGQGRERKRRVAGKELEEEILSSPDDRRGWTRETGGNKKRMSIVNRLGVTVPAPNQDQQQSPSILNSHDTTDTEREEPNEKQKQQ